MEWKMNTKSQEITGKSVWEDDDDDDDDDIN